jgi:uncharacterized protein
VRTHGLPEIRVILHGGEPLLAGLDRLSAIVTALREAVRGRSQLRVGLQTNGVLLDDPTLAALQANEISVGVSLDGTADDNDRHRRRPDGRGSHDDVHRALMLLGSPRYRSAFAGLLCTVDTRADPVACYEDLLRYAPPTVDFLLPHANWAQPPYRHGTRPTPYGDWLVEVFDRWYDAPRQETHVRLFEEIINLVLGGSSRSEQVGLSPVAVAVIESDGSIEQVDSLRSAYPGATATGLNVRADPIDAALDHPGVIARQIGVRALGDACRACSIHRICGAGHYAHRYRPGAGFRNASVYCADLLRTIDHVRNRVSADLTRLVSGTAS